MGYFVTDKTAKQIKRWLKKNDKRYATSKISDLALDCWCSEAENQMPTEVAVLEIRAMYSMTGNPITLTLTKEAFEFFPEAA